MLGYHDATTLVSLSNLAYYYMVVEDYREAAACYETFLAGRSATLGEDHPDTEKARQQLEDARQLLDEMQ